MSDELTCGTPFSREVFDTITRRAVVEYAKWNVNDGGASTLCRFPLLLGRRLLAELTRLALAIESEARAAESELVGRPDLHDRLGLPRALRRALRLARPGRGRRFARVDFHPVAGGGFAITECNNDVAGGFNEAALASMVAEYVSGAAAGGDPAAALAAAIVDEIGVGRRVGVLHLTNFTDDHQVARYVGRTLVRAGLVPVPFGPWQLRWDGAHACALVGTELVRLDAVFRFFPAEWLPKLPQDSNWQRLFEPGPTCWVNPATTLLTQSKRFPLVWRDLRSTLPTWEALLPETRSPLTAMGKDWVLKPALAHEGYRVGVSGVTERTALAGIALEARVSPSRWVAQRRFAAAALTTPDGPRFPCIGVYVVDGKAAGLYARLAAKPLIDDGARDIVVLVRES